MTLCIGPASSRPTQTTAVRPPVKPQNQASLLSDVVPVLPATSRPAMAAWTPVPSVTTARSI